MQTHNFTIVRGDTLAFALKLSKFDPSDVNRLIMTVKKKSKDEEIIFAKTLDDGITLEKDNMFRIRVAPEDTEQLKSGTYAYDVEITIGDDVYTPLMGSFTLIQDITTR